MSGRVNPPKPNINADDLARFTDSIWRAGVELYIWAELFPTWRAWYEHPDCPHPGCAVCAEPWDGM